MSVRVGLFGLFDVLPSGRAAEQLAAVADAGLDHFGCGDHVSFGGTGFDGLIQATALAALHPSLPVHTGIYLLPLRHPVLVARQLADIARMAPGRLVFGVGIGGEARHEVAITGVDPATRGRRMEELLTAVRALLTGESTTFRGEFFDFEDAVIAPAADVPILVGGRSDAAVRRAGRLGDGWLGIWNSARRFAEATALAAETAASVGRPVPTRNVMQAWCAFGPSRESARELLSREMEAFYGLPFESFERYSPYGTPEDVAEALAPYVAAGCTEFSLIARAGDPAEAIEGAAKVKRLLAPLAP